MKLAAKRITECCTDYEISSSKNSASVLSIVSGGVKQALMVNANCTSLTSCKQSSIADKSFDCCTTKEVHINLDSTVLKSHLKRLGSITDRPRLPNFPFSFGKAGSKITISNNNLTATCTGDQTST